jgi:hypothetical protein
MNRSWLLTVPDGPPASCRLQGARRVRYRVERLMAEHGDAKLIDLLLPVGAPVGAERRSVEVLHCP